MPDERPEAELPTEEELAAASVAGVATIAHRADGVTVADLREAMDALEGDAFDKAMREYSRQCQRWGTPEGDANKLYGAHKKLRALYDARGQELELERMRLAAVAVAASGGDVSDCRPEYRNAAVEDVVTLRAKYDAARRDAAPQEAG